METVAIAEVFFTTGSMKWCLQPIHIWQFQLLHDGTPIHATVSMLCLPAHSQEREGDTRELAVTWREQDSVQFSSVLCI